MTVSFNVVGGYRSDALQPSVTSKAAIYAVDERSQSICLNLRVTNTSGDAVNLTLHFYDSSKSLEVVIYPLTAIVNNTTTLIDLGGLALDPNDELRATVGTGSALDLVLTYATQPGRSA